MAEIDAEVKKQQQYGIIVNDGNEEEQDTYSSSFVSIMFNYFNDSSTEAVSGQNSERINALKKK